MIKKGDCKTALKKIEPNSIDLIYLDPPFFTQKKQSQRTRDNLRGYAFDDNWESIESYKTYIEERLLECKRVLKRLEVSFTLRQKCIALFKNCPRQCLWSK